MPKQRPRVFVGSSSEGLKIAKAIQVELDQSCEVEVWRQGVFGLSQGTLESLALKLKGFDFAVFVLTADDLIIKCEQAIPSVRDNVIFELGFFLGGLGRDRTFMVYDRTKPPDLPSDLDGVTAADYEPHSSGNLAAALGAPCTKIQTEIDKVGLKKKYGSYGVGVESVTFAATDGVTEPTGSILFTQLSEENAAGSITVSYGVPITVPSKDIIVIGSGGLMGAKLNQNQSILDGGKVKMDIPAGGRYGNTVKLSGVRVNLAVNPGLTCLATSISTEGNTISPNESSVLVISAIGCAIAVKNVSPGDVLDTSKTPAVCFGQFTIRETFHDVFIGEDKISSNMTNGTEFLLELTRLMPGIDLEIENSPTIKVGEKVILPNGANEIRLILLKTISEVTIKYNIRARTGFKVQSPFQVTGTISLGPRYTGAKPIQVPSYSGTTGQKQAMQVTVR